MGGQGKEVIPSNPSPCRVGSEDAGRQGTVRGRWMEPLPQWYMDRNDSLKVPR